MGSVASGPLAARLGSRTVLRVAQPLVCLMLPAIGFASTPRVKDSSGTWVDGATTFYEGRAWNDLAAHATESLRRGDRVIVLGALRTERWTDSTGDEREALRVDVDEIGPSLRFANAKVTKAQRGTTTSAPSEEAAADAAKDAVVRQLGGRPMDAPF